MRAAIAHGYWQKLFVATIVLSGLEAYSVGPIPLTWLGQAMLLAVIAFVPFKSLSVPGVRWVVLLLMWCGGVTVANSLAYDYATMMPPSATTSYLVYVLLRFVAAISFLSTAWLTISLHRTGGIEAVSRGLVIVGSLMATAALYIYIAQIAGLPEPPRSRIGTSGGDQMTTFNYAFHRAMGTFREPSHLAEWLVLPLCLSLALGRRPLNAHSVLMGGALLLTGSLNAIASIMAGLAMTVMLPTRWRLRGGSARVLTKLSFALVMMAGVFLMMVDGDTDLFGILERRIAEIWDGGMYVSNRGFIYSFMADSPAPLCGYGVGNSNLVLSSYMRSMFPESFLSLYIQYLYSAGLIGLALLALALAAPVWRIVGLGRENDSGGASAERGMQRFAILAAYLSWCLMLQFRSEELTIPFAVVFGLLAAEAFSSAQAIRHGLPR